MKHEAFEKLARILRTRPEVLEDLAQKMEKITGKTGIIEKIVQENEILAERTLSEFGLSPEERTAERVYESLMRRLQHMDEHLYEFLDKPDLSKMSSACGKLCEVAEQLAQSKRGFFIKKEKAVGLLEKFPPKNLLDHFGYATVRELVDKHGFSSVFASLRFAQDDEWMHTFFNESYKELTASDFEERDVELKVLETEWLAVAEKFMKHKYHNVSHLKELGIIFIVPLELHVAGETSRMFTLLLHYLNEVPFYSKLFRKFSTEPDFITKLQSLLRGDVPDAPAPDHGKTSFRIVQRYLAKDDENDFRLLEPHVNPEAEHWYRAEGDLGRMATMPGTMGEGHALGYWQGLDFVGDFFKAVDGSEKLVSFDLIDLIMSLVKKGEIKYLYHQEEALWNKIFIEYLGREKMNELIEENIINGFIQL
ncbi:MAG: hypothetical protein A3A33_02120 [Candidatus Yanofskybacteria bacterium RIFCSPLOWO2_01_FULL_49_25]|uniref:Uncharacterized protein n=1 Tax=Candidatus Yanofskybacteria bacterium RIFCSPLOWO2_01_FULL_49_25 TaxID=1802701 RepID=A0A1F8GU27_9BACT|nr:MAG: hypothetical protein A3A33_02120 [Candidatus Yanofskybacteria bacterium RIFCSPLOWO2_01_FULL_49_25]